MPYTPTVFVDVPTGTSPAPGTPPISAAELNKLGNGVATADTAAAGKQPLDTDLTALAALTATTDNVIQSVASAWASRTPTQLKTTLALAKADVGLGNVDNTTDATKPTSTAQAAYATSRAVALAIVLGV